MDLLSLSHKVALVTGANSGIGKATAILFAQLGCRIALVARDKTRLEETRQSCLDAFKLDVIADEKEPFLCISADLTDPAQVKRVCNETIDHFKQLDILVNNAGCLIQDSVENFDLSNYERIMNTNVRAVVLLTSMAVPSLIASKGSIVNVSSVCGTRAFCGVLSYCMTKAALDQFTKCTALDLAPKGVRVNSVNPGVIVTELHRNSGMSEEAYDKFLERSKVTHALGRPGTPEEVAKAIAFLASSASSFTTGDLLPVDGGRSAMCPR